MCGLLKRDWLADVDIGFAFLPRFWAKGYAFEAASGVLAPRAGRLRPEAGRGHHLPGQRGLDPPPGEARLPLRADGPGLRARAGGSAVRARGLNGRGSRPFRRRGLGRTMFETLVTAGIAAAVAVVGWTIARWTGPIGTRRHRSVLLVGSVVAFVRRQRDAHAAGRAAGSRNGTSRLSSRASRSSPPSSGMTLRCASRCARACSRRCGKARATRPSWPASGC